MKEPVVALQVGLHTQNFVYSPDMTRTLLRSSETRSGVYFTRVMENFVGDPGAFRRLSPQALASINRTLIPLTQENYLAKVSAALARVLERETSDFVTFNRSVVDQTFWERNGSITLEEGDSSTGSDSDSLSCRANLFALTRSFATYIITNVFMGQALLDFHSDILDDLWKWDSGYLLLIAGAPRWMPSPATSAAYAARDRVLKTMSVIQASFSALEDGRNAPLEFRDLDDVSELMQDRMRFWRTSGISPSLGNRLDTWLLWKMTMDSSKLIFWNIIRVYSNPDLLANVRKEMAPYVQVIRSDPKETGLPFVEPPRISIDTGKLFTSCPLLKATYAETIRLDSNPISYRQLTANLTLKESDEDAALHGSGKQPRSYKFFAGDILGLASGAHHIDPAYYPDPKSFNPERFLISNSDSNSSDNKTEESSSFDWKNVLPFGGDKTFSPLIEKQVLLITAAIISLWDIEPASQQEKKSEFKIPGHRISGNAYMPSSDVRARLRRRPE
jgi:Cytochrome P450